jgi:hypothetical protein
MNTFVKVSLLAIVGLQSIGAKANSDAVELNAELQDQQDSERDEDCSRNDEITEPSSQDRNERWSLELKKMIESPKESAIEFQRETCLN